MFWWTIIRKEDRANKTPCSSRSGVADGRHADATGRGVGYIRASRPAVHGAAPVHQGTLPPHTPGRREAHATLSVLAERYRSVYHYPYKSNKNDDKISQLNSRDERIQDPIS